MAHGKFTKRLVALTLCFAAVMPRLPAFTLLGPYAPWMSHSIGYHRSSDTGGPMDIDEGYRWNIPVVTYGFDQEFVDYFGQRGVEEVEKAVAILNDLPPAAQIDLASFQDEAWLPNPTASALGLIDLKSAALVFLLEQFGLTDAERFAWTIRQRVVDGQATNTFVVQRNFDPETLAPSPYINGELLDYTMMSDIANSDGVYADAVEFSVSLLGPLVRPVAGDQLRVGLFCTGLSRDDVGGIRFLLGSQNRKVEALLPGITAAPGNTNAVAVVNVALRPGVEKIQFVRMPLNEGRFTPMTNVFTDTFITNGVAQQQELQRVITEPDIVFQGRDLGLKFFFPDNYPPLFYAEMLERRDTSCWQNNAAVNGHPSGAGPGVIPPGAGISFGKMGRYSAAHLGDPSHGLFDNWASFDESPDDLIVYSGTERATSATVSTRISNEGTQPVFNWKLLIQTNVTYRIDATADLKDWTSVGSVISTNDGFVTFSHPISDTARYFRALPDPAPTG